MIVNAFHRNKKRKWGRSDAICHSVCNAELSAFHKYGIDKQKIWKKTLKNYDSQDNLSSVSSIKYKYENGQPVSRDILVKDASGNYVSSATEMWSKSQERYYNPHQEPALDNFERTGVWNDGASSNGNAQSGAGENTQVDDVDNLLNL